MTEKNACVANLFVCEPCDFKCSKKSNYVKHLSTAKHINNDMSLKNDDVKKSKSYECECGKEYKHRQGLYIHKKKCYFEKKETINPIEKEYSIIKNENMVELLMKENIEFKNIVLEVVKNNSDLQKQTHEMQKQMMEMCKQANGGMNNSHNTNTNSHNKTFNLQFFLNEQCKDAMNIMDFVNTFQLQFSDFEKIGEVGYVEGISNIIIDKLNEMDIYKRPIHCSDAKREIMYVKDKDVWEKENPTNSKIRLAVRHISKKNSDMVRPWLVKHPGALYSDHHLCDAYQMMIIESMGGNSGTLEQSENKIIKKISKMVLIDKRQ